MECVQLFQYVYVLMLNCYFFFQAEDGIRDGRVTGVQTCALPICEDFRSLEQLQEAEVFAQVVHDEAEQEAVVEREQLVRSEERRVGKECRSRWWPDH